MPEGEADSEIIEAIRRATGANARYDHVIEALLMTRSASAAENPSNQSSQRSVW